MATKKEPAKKAAVKRQVSSKSPQQKNVEETVARLMVEVSQSNGRNFPDFRVAQPSKLRPKLKLPVIQLPKFNAPVLRLPKFKMPALQIPKFKTPVVRVPRIKFPVVKLPKFKAPVRRVSTYEESSTAKKSLPLVVVAAVVAIIIAGFWGPQIVRALGIPIDPKPFTAIYFQDPTIVETGIVAGDLIVFGVHNGFREQRNLIWRIDSGSVPLTSGQVKVNADEDSQIAVSTTGAIPGELLKIFIEGTTAPITIQVVG